MRLVHGGMNVHIYVIAAIIVAHLNVLVYSERTTEQHIKSLIEWVRSKGGFFHADIEVRKAGNDDKSSYYGIFAKKDIPAKTELIVIPKECLISAGGVQLGDSYWFKWQGKDWYVGKVIGINMDKRTVDVVYEDGSKQYGIDMESARKDGDISMECGTIRNLIKEMKLGDDSDYAPYVNYIIDQNAASLPSFWSDAGKAFLLHVQGELPPKNLIGWSWSHKCGGNKDPIEDLAAHAQVSRGWDDFLVPLYDMMNHRSGNWTNTENSYMKWNKDIIVRASKDIHVHAGD